MAREDPALRTVFSEGPALRTVESVGRPLEQELPAGRWAAGFPAAPPAEWQKSFYHQKIKRWEKEAQDFRQIWLIINRIQTNPMLFHLHVTSGNNRSKKSNKNANRSKHFLSQPSPSHQGHAAAVVLARLSPAAPPAEQGEDERGGRDAEQIRRGVLGRGAGGPEEPGLVGGLLGRAGRERGRGADGRCPAAEARAGAAAGERRAQQRDEEAGQGVLRLVAGQPLVAPLHPPPPPPTPLGSPPRAQSSVSAPRNASTDAGGRQGAAVGGDGGVGIEPSTSGGAGICWYIRPRSGAPTRTRKTDHPCAREPPRLRVLLPPTEGAAPAEAQHVARSARQPSRQGEIDAALLHEKPPRYSYSKARTCDGVLSLRRLLSLRGPPLPQAADRKDVRRCEICWSPGRGQTTGVEGGSGVRGMR
ncbi:hypothetical protein U9M48_029520 [Paspalum notatum var. saurae]|uniref:Uncharacterized protein n=1 Tax=Paspalum notatum var. saurae TaxID=547442 RepID=A0AAQ3TZN0_PASNO